MAKKIVNMNNKKLWALLEETNWFEFISLLLEGG